MRRNWAIGFSILELSKFIMTSLYYKVIKPAFNNRCTLLFSDTDSYCLLLPAQSLEEGLSRISPVMDFSNLPQDHPLYDKSRKNIAGYLKLETNIHDPITSFIGLRAKTYAFETESGKMESKCKGIKRCVRRNLRMEHYRRCIEKKDIQRATQYTLNSKSHKVRMMKTNKICYTSFEEKRFLFRCGIHSVPYGSFLIRYYFRNNEECVFCQHPYLLI